MLASLASLSGRGERAQDTILRFHCEPRDLFTHFEVSLRPIVRVNTQSSCSTYLFGARIIHRWHNLTV